MDKIKITCTKEQKEEIIDVLDHACESVSRKFLALPCDIKGCELDTTPCSECIEKNIDWTIKGDREE